MQSEKRGSDLRWCVGMLMACWAAGGCDTGPKTVVCPCEIRDVIMYKHTCQPRDKPNLSEVPFHFDLGPSLTQRIFHGAQYNEGTADHLKYKGTYYCIAVMEGGAERGLWLSCPGAYFWIEGQGGHYILDGAAREAVDGLKEDWVKSVWGGPVRPGPGGRARARGLFL
jgi:hypothetical protein